MVDRIPCPCPTQHRYNHSESPRSSQITPRRHSELCHRCTQRRPVHLPLRRPEMRKQLRFPRSREYVSLATALVTKRLSTKLDHIVFENQEYEEIKSKILGKTRSRTINHPTLSEAQLINDHDRHALTSKIVRVDREELGYGDEAGGFPTRLQRVPTRRKWDHCDICLRLTGTKVYFGGNPKFRRYH
jgi:hypothetical protein